MERVKKLWDKVSYEVMLFVAITAEFLLTRGYDVDAWSAAWNVLDYSVGNGSRLLVGSIYRLFYKDFIDGTVAYKYTCIAMLIGIFLLSVVLGRFIRLTTAYAPLYKNVVLGTVLLYLAAPFSMAYLWNSSNIGKLDLYLFITAMVCLLIMLGIKNIYVKMLLITALGVIGLAFHQAYAFSYYPMIVSAMCVDVFGEYKVNVKNLILAVVSGVIEIAAFLYFQFGGGLYYDSAEEVAEVLYERTNMLMAVEAIDLEYFRDLEYVQNTLIRSFFMEEHPFLHLAAVFVLLSPVIVLYVMMWKDVFAYYKQEGKKIFAGPHLYMLLTNLCFVPIFAMQTDWGRWLAPLFAGQIFMFLFYLAKKDAAMYHAFGKMIERVKKYPLVFVAIIVWIGMLDSFEAKSFQDQATALVYALRHGFHQ